MILAPLLLAGATACSFAHPPAWPSHCHMSFDKDAVLLVRSGIKPPPHGVVVLGWLGTSMPGEPDDTPLRVWVYTHQDGEVVHSRLLLAEALERLYADVIEWLAAHETKKSAKR